MNLMPYISRVTRGVCVVFTQRVTIYHHAPPYGLAAALECQ